MRALFDFLPLSNEQDPPIRDSDDTRDRSVSHPTYPIHPASRLASFFFHLLFPNLC